MVEPLAAGGVVSAVYQLTSELVTLTTTLRHHLKVMRRAPDEVQSFLMETSNFTCLLNFFTELANRPAQDVERKGQRKRERMIVEIQQQCTYIRDKMEYLVDRLAILAKENMTPLEGLLERIRYLLDKPDIRDLRLSLQISALTVNCLTTLFAWEEASLKDDTRAASLLEQLKNLLPMAKKASIELAEHQRKHGTSYESGLPGPNNAMLAASDEVLRQIAHVIRPYSHADTAAHHRSSSDTRTERRRTSPVVQRNRQSEPLMSSPFVTDGGAANSVEYIPRRRQHRVSFKPSDRTTGLSSNGHGPGTVHDGNAGPAVSSPELQVPPGKPPSRASLAHNGPSYVAELDAGATPSNKGKQIEVNKTPHQSTVSLVHYEVRPKPRREDYILEIPDPAKPRVHPRIRRSNGVISTICNEAQSPDKCRNKLAPSDDKAYQNNARGVSPMPEPIKVGNSAKSSREDTRLPPPPADQTPFSLPAPTESEGSGRSDRDPEDPRWSRTNLPSSKSSSPSTHSHRSPANTRRRRASTAAGRTGEQRDQTGPQESGSLKKEAAESPQQPRAYTPYRKPEKEHADAGYEKEQGAVHSPSEERSRSQSRLQRNDGPAEEQQKQPVFKAYKPGVLDTRNVSSVDEWPVPHVPGPPSEAPSRGTSGRRRPRRPRPNTMML